MNKNFIEQFMDKFELQVNERFYVESEYINSNDPMWMWRCNYEFDYWINW